LIQSIKGNPELVRKSIFDAFMYAKMGNPKVEEAMGTFLKEGKIIPTAANAFRNEAVMENMDKILAVKDFYHGKSGACDAFDKILNVVGQAEGSDKNSEALSDFYDSMNKYYPNSNDVRVKIINNKYKDIIKSVKAKLLKL